MNNGLIAKNFLATLSNTTKNEILKNIAKTYGITSEKAFAEVTDDDAEHLLEYLTGNVRTATHVLMKRHGLA